MEDGTKFSEFTEQHTKRPWISLSTFLKNFRIGAREVLEEKTQEEIIELIKNIEKLDNVNELRTYC